MHKRDQTTQETVLDSAMKFSNHDIVKYLKENGVEKYDRINRTALQFTADEGTKEVMTLLLTKKADINAKSDDEIILFTNAAKAKHYDVMGTALIKYVLDLFCICKGTRTTETIFHAAADINNHTVFKNWLISFSRNLDSKRNNDFFLYFKSHMSSHINPYNNIWIFEKLPKDINAMDSIKRHIVELIAAGFYVSNQNIKAVCDEDI
ncbi:uncharacterized protein LOC103568730 [Microplitis demolitor]|uniref:uncharacterized protein LOC103568730 n=1 Tax=Microplitis demolitor TaxID=69319 RepID=UPI0004CD99C1|nr:uncharacterized protein LOC103568730 [Microplitis demolitor]